MHAIVTQATILQQEVDDPTISFLQREKKPALSQNAAHNMISIGRESLGKSQEEEESFSSRSEADDTTDLSSSVEGESLITAATGRGVASHKDNRPVITDDWPRIH